MRNRSFSNIRITGYFQSRPNCDNLLHKKPIYKKINN